MARPLPRYLKHEEVTTFFQAITNLRDRAIFMLMLRCGLRVEEVAHLSLHAIDLAHRRILVCHGKGGKDRIVYISNDAYRAIVDYLKRRSASKAKRVFYFPKELIGAYQYRFEASKSAWSAMPEILD